MYLNIKETVNKTFPFLIIETDLGQNLPERKVLTEKEVNSKFTNLPPFAFKKNRALVEVTLQEVEERNRNGRWYSKEELFPELTCARTTELLNAGNLRCESGHPLSKELSRQQTIVKSNCSAIILKLWTEGNYIKALVRGTNNKLGDEFNEDILDGISPSFSLRALGSIVNTKRGAEVKGIKVITWDEVIFPSHKRAYANKVITLDESTNNSVNENGMLIPIMNKNIIECIKQESFTYKRLEEAANCIDTIFNDISLINGGRDMQLVDSIGNVVIAPVDNYLHDEIMNYCYNK